MWRMSTKQFSVLTYEECPRRPRPEPRVWRGMGRSCWPDPMNRSPMGESCLSVGTGRSVAGRGLAAQARVFR